MFSYGKPDVTALVDELFDLSKISPAGKDWQTELQRIKSRKNEILRSLKKHEAAAIREIIGRIRDEGVTAWDAGKFLRSFGKAGLITLMQRYAESDGAARYALLRAAWEFEADGIDAVHWLTELLDDIDPKIRSLAAHGLGRIGSSASPAQQRLVRMAGEDLPECRMRAMFALQHIGADSSIITQVFLEGLSSADAGVVNSSIAGLAPLDFDPEPVRDRLFQWLCRSDNSPFLASDYLKLINRLQVFTQAEIVGLANAASNSKIGGIAQAQVIELIWRHSGDFQCCKKLIDQMLADESYESACDAISYLGAAGVSYALCLLELLQTNPDNGDLAWAVVDAIGFMGPAAAEYLPQIEQLTAHPSSLVRRRAEKAVRRINGEAVVEEDDNQH